MLLRINSGWNISLPDIGKDNNNISVSLFFSIKAKAVANDKNNVTTNIPTEK